MHHGGENKCKSTDKLYRILQSTQYLLYTDDLVFIYQVAFQNTHLLQLQVVEDTVQ